MSYYWLDWEPNQHLKHHMYGKMGSKFQTTDRFTTRGLLAQLFFHEIQVANIKHAVQILTLVADQSCSSLMTSHEGL
jgi:hypothetical protein